MTKRTPANISAACSARNSGFSRPRTESRRSPFSASTPMRSASSSPTSACPTKPVSVSSRRSPSDYPDIIKILSTAYSDIDAAIGSVNQGGIFRYMTKPWDIPQLEVTLRRAMEFFTVKRERDALLGAKMQAMGNVLLSSRLAAFALAPVCAGIACNRAAEADRLLRANRRGRPPHRIGRRLGLALAGLGAPARPPGRSRVGPRNPASRRTCRAGSGRPDQPLWRASSRPPVRPEFPAS